MGCQWNNCNSPPLCASFALRFKKLALGASRLVAHLSLLVASYHVARLSLSLTLLCPALSFPSSLAPLSSIAQNAHCPAISCLQTSISSRGKLSRPNAHVSLTVTSRRVASLSPSPPALPHSLLPIFPDSTLVFVFITQKASSPDLLPTDRHQPTLAGAPSRCPYLSLPPSSPALGSLSLSLSIFTPTLSVSLDLSSISASLSLSLSHLCLRLFPSPGAVSIPLTVSPVILELSIPPSLPHTGKIC